MSPVVDEVIVIVPVGVVHVGSTTLAVGAAGADGAGLIVTEAAPDIQPAAFFTVRL